MTNIIAAVLFLTGLVIGVVALFEPLAGMIVIIYRYLQKILRGPGPFPEIPTTPKSKKQP